MDDAIISREAEVREVRRSSASDNTVADCSNLVFYSAFYWQPVQIPKNGNVMFMPVRPAHCKCKHVQTY